MTSGEQSGPAPIAPRRDRASWWLALGALCGLAAAATSLVQTTRERSAALPPDAVARVGDVSISRATFESLLQAVAAERRDAATVDARQLLDRLIEEELLVQYAQRLGLVRSDRRVRAELVGAVLGGIGAAADAAEPTERELADFYAEQRDYFRQPARLRAQEIFVAAGGDPAAALTRAQHAAEALARGVPIDEVRARAGAETGAALPETLLPPAKLREYLGPGLVETLESLAVGATSGAIESPQGFHVLRLLERQESRQPELDEIREEVLAEYRRRAAEHALRERLRELRGEAEIRIADDLR